MMITREQLSLQAPPPSAAKSRNVNGALESDAATQAGTRAAFAMRWQRGPEFIRVARGFPRRGLPVVRLWESGPSLLAIGVSPRGVPGIYFTLNDSD
jgi:hypothetical protein